MPASNAPSARPDARMSDKRMMAFTPRYEGWSADMNHEDARRLLDRIGVLKHACDLDLLIFFARHPRSLLASESLASFLGYDLKEIADSLDVLLSARLLTREQTSAHAARLYVFAIDHTSGGANSDWVPSLLALASTREGRLALRQALTRRRRDTASGRPDAMARPGPRRVVLQPKRRTGTT